MYIYNKTITYILTMRRCYTKYSLINASLVVLSVAIWVYICRMKLNPKLCVDLNKIHVMIG